MAQSRFQAIGKTFADIDREIVINEKIVADKIDIATQKRIIRQVEEEYQLAFRYNQSKRATILSRLKLYNNQRRNLDAVGDPLMFTVFNTIHAALYDDHLSQTWEGRGGESDSDVEENLNVLSDFDNDVMGMDELTYFWNWDAEFTGRGLLLLNEFDRSPGVMAPMPELIDAVSFIRDPLATSVNGNSRGHGSLRFGGWEVGATYYELKAMPAYFNVGNLRKDKEISSLLDQAKQLRDEAQGRVSFDPLEQSLGKYNNYRFQLLNWFTTFRGDKYLITLGNMRTEIVRLIKLRDQNEWPIIDRAFYPMSHDWDGVSIPDLTEDKQRMRAVLLNLGLISAKADAMGQYLYDKGRGINPNDLNFRQNKFTGVNGRPDTAIYPMPKSQVHQYVNVLMDILDTSSQKATATPEIQQGVQSADKRTLGELNLVSAKVDTRYSMTAKVYGWSARRFWLRWYKMYKDYFKADIDEKIVRIQGPLEAEWRPLDKDNIVSEVDPDVRIESKTTSEAKKQRALQLFQGFIAGAIADPDTNRRYLFKKQGKLSGLTKQEVNMAFPPTIDEIQATDENELLNAGKLVKINVNDDHQVHLNIHVKAEQNAQAKAHELAHKKAMIIKRNRPDLFPPPPVPGSGPKVGESINFKDLPPDGQAQMAKQAGINLQPPQPDNQTNSQATPPPANVPIH